MPAILGVIFSWFASFLSVSSGAVVAWWVAHRAAIRVVNIALGIAVIVLIAGLVVTAAGRVVVGASSLMSSSAGDVSFMAVANTVFPLTEVVGQMFFLISCRLSLLVLSLSSYAIKSAYHVVKKA